MGTINGIFIYNSAPQNGAVAKLWKITAFASYADSGETVLDDPLAATSVECNCSDGGEFAVGDVIKMGTERCLIWKISTDKLYIIRGWHQTTPAEHAAATAIYDETITPPVQDDSEPGSGQQGSEVTTGVAYGGDGAYRFDSVPEMEYYASVYYSAHRSFIHHFVERNDITLEQLLLADGDMVIRNGDTVTRFPKGTIGQWLKMGANRPEWDDITAVATITIAETEVFSGNSPDAWADLDLSGTIGANAALVLLKVYCDTSSNLSVAFRKNGDTDEFYRTAPYVGGVAIASTNYDAHHAILVATDAAGKIEWKAGAVQAGTTVDIIAYIKGA